MRSLLLVASLTLAPTFVSAQAYDLDSMQSGLTMLEGNVARIFDEYDIDADPTNLELSQIVEIVSIVRENERLQNPTVTRSAIEVALTRD